MPDEVPRFLHKVVAAVTPYAAELIKAQFAQCPHYHSGERPVYEGYGTMDGTLRDVYKVIRNEQPVSSSLRPSVDKDGDIDVWRTDDDFGLGDSQFKPSRMAHRFGCSCQYYTAIKLPCRHQLHVWLRLSLLGSTEEYPVEHIGSKWLVLSLSEQAQCTHALHAHAARQFIYSRSRPELGTRAVVPTAARYQVAMSDFKPIAQLATLSMGNLSFVQETLIECLRILSSGKDTASACAMGALPTDKRRKKVSLNTDERSLQDKLGLTMNPLPESEALLQMEKGMKDNTAVMVKQEGLRKGGWYSGLINAQKPNGSKNTCDAPEAITLNGKKHMSNYVLWYDGEEMWDAVYLGPENYTEKANANKGSWMILADRPAGASRDAIATMSLPQSKPVSNKRAKHASEHGRRTKKNPKKSP